MTTRDHDNEARRDAAWLIVRTPAERVLEVPLTRRRGLVIGRGAECDVQVSDPKMSREHAVVRPYFGSFVLQDRDSENGLRFRGRRVRTRRLRPGDRLVLGDTEVEFQQEVDPVAPPPWILRIDAWLGSPVGRRRLAELREVRDVVDRKARRTLAALGALALDAPAGREHPCPHGRRDYERARKARWRAESSENWSRGGDGTLQEDSAQAKLLRRVRDATAAMLGARFVRDGVEDDELEPFLEAGQLVTWRLADIDREIAVLERYVSASGSASD